MPKTLILDSTQISSFYECPTLWDYAHNQSIALSNVVRDDIAAGSMGHKLLEIYLRERGSYPAATPQAAQAVKKMLAFNVDAEDKCETDQHGFPLSPELRQRVLARLTDYLMVYSQNDYKTLMRQRPCIKIDENGLPFDSFTNEPLVEQGFSYKLLDAKEYLFVLEGKVDWMINLSGQPAWVDHKWQFRERRLYPKSIQFRNYSLALNLNLGVINYIRMHTKLNDNTFVRDPISFSSLELQWWKQELIEKYIEIVRMRERGAFLQNFGSCGGKFGYACDFTQLCEERNADSRAKIQEAKYVKKVEWKPW